MSVKFTNYEKRMLREIANEAHQNELHIALSELFEKFMKWADDYYSSFDMNDYIHEFHMNVSNELMKLYDQDDPELSVAIAISRGAISTDRIEESLLKKLEPFIKTLKD